jgi:hypothetical protein
LVRKHSLATLDARGAESAAGSFEKFLVGGQRADEL